jgi:hypothetical protein
MERGRHLLKEGERKRKAWEARDTKDDKTNFIGFVENQLHNHT